MSSRPLTFLSDYGLDDDFVGVCHAVIGRIVAGAPVVDLTHGVPRHDIRTGAIMLRRALPYAAPGVHLAVVDPEVGTKRRAIALQAAEDDRVLVGPDNGLLTLAAQRFGGIVEAVDISRSPHRLEPVSATFQGRDLFAPVAAAIAGGVAVSDAGEPLDPDEVERLDMPMAEAEPDGLIVHALAFDGFGNVTLDVEHEELTALGLQLGSTLLVDDVPARYATTFADVEEGDLLLYEDAYRTLALAVNRGSARELLGIRVDEALRVRRS